MYEDVKLGRKPAVLPANMPNFRAHALATMIAPPRLNRDHVAIQPKMDGNNRLGNCTAAGIANAIRAQAALGGFQCNITELDTIAFYSCSTGYDPLKPGTDEGGVETEVLKYQSQHGFHGEAQTDYDGLWGNVEAQDLNMLRVVMARLGVGYLGVNLALADQQDGTWDTDTPASFGDPTPGSWGGHCLLAWDYTGTNDTDIVRLVTWGALKSATWRWVKSRMEEAHGLYHPQMFNALGRNFAGIDRDKLASDCASFASA